MNFDFDDAQAVMFGVARRPRRGPPEFFDIPVQNDILVRLHEMASATWGHMQVDVDDDPPQYDPAETYPTKRYLTIALDEAIVELFQNLYEVQNFEPGGLEILNNPRSIFCYFAQLIDQNDRRMFAMRRSSSFKSILRQTNRFLIWQQNELRLFGDDVFRLDHEFDLLIDDEAVHILHPNGFEQLGSLQQVLRDAAAENIEQMNDRLPFIIWDWGAPDFRLPIGLTRKLAALRNENLEGLTAHALQQLCQSTNVPFQQLPDGTLEFAQADVEDLLDTLSRRRARIEVIPGVPELFTFSGKRRLPLA